MLNYLNYIYILFYLIIWLEPTYYIILQLCFASYYVLCVYVGYVLEPLKSIKYDIRVFIV